MRTPYLSFILLNELYCIGLRKNLKNLKTKKPKNSFFNLIFFQPWEEVKLGGRICMVARYCHQLFFWFGLELQLFILK